MVRSNNNTSLQTKWQTTRFFSHRDVCLTVQNFYECFSGALTFAFLATGMVKIYQYPCIYAAFPFLKNVVTNKGGIKLYSLAGEW